ncbi:MAG: YlxR family protein [Actinobacteria bacterium]|nr:MAG: YlxR family protein [Actinomycetota bacterium]
MKARKTPERTCVGCGTQAGKRDLVRIVRTPDGHVVLDVTGKANGRGAYLCAKTDCFDAAAKRRRFTAALRVNLMEDDLERLRRDLEGVLESRTKA